MLLTQDQEMIRDAVRDFAQAELCPVEVGSFFPIFIFVN